jgi:mitochondrial protein import protein ZIM17
MMQLSAYSRRSLQSGYSSLSFSPSSTRPNAPSSPALFSRQQSTASSSNETSLPANTSSTPPEQLEPKLSLTFTCTVPDCGERSTHQFTKRAYQKGVVLVQCPGCKNRYDTHSPLHDIPEQGTQIPYIRHLIADHLGWFKESTQDGKLRTIEDLLKAKGEKVQRGRLDVDGTVEYSE